jgi:PAS domain S-box-containing protein
MEARVTAQNSRTILLVEDEAIIALAESKTLRKFGYGVITAGDGDEAVRKATCGAPVDLVLMDIDLGEGMDGTESARRILEKRNIPIVFLTSHSERAMVERVRGITRFGYVIKNSGDFVLQSSLEMAFELFEALESVSVNESFQRTLVQTIPDLVWLKDADGVYLSCNPQFERFFGATEAEIVGKTDYDFLDRGIADSFREYDRKAIEAGKPSVNEEWITFASDGRRVLLETIKTPMKGRDGRLIGVLGVSRDITERKVAGDKLRAALQQMHEIIEFLPDPTLVIDQDRKVVAWNKAMEQLTGVKKEEMLGRGDYAYALPFYGDRRPILINLIDIATEELEAKYDYVRRVENSIYAETYIGHLNQGAGAYLWGAAAPLFNASGERIGAIEVIRDVTERKLAEGKLSATLQQMNDIIEFLPDPAYVIDKDHKVVAWNRALEELTGARKEDMLGQGDHAYALPFYGERRPILIDFLGLPEAALKAEYRNVRRVGNNIYAETRASRLNKGAGADLWVAAAPLLDPAGAQIGAIEVIRDVSERIRTERDLVQSNGEKELLLKEMQHRIQNTLAIISGFLSLEIDKFKDEEIRSVLQDAIARIGTIGQLYQSLYRSSALNSINLRQYVQEMAEQLLRSYALKPDMIRLSLELEDIRFDIKRAMSIGLVLNELLTNAIKYAFPLGENGMIRIKLSRIGDTIVLMVSDDGKGLCADVENGKRKGIGLHIVDLLAKELGGDFGIEGKNGTTARLVIAL